MNFSISNIAWNSADDEAVYAMMQKNGFFGLEIAPTKIIPEAPYSHTDRAVAWVGDLKDRFGFCVPSMQSIWYGKGEKLFGSEYERNNLLDYTQSAIDFASSIGCKNLVFGCPKNRAKPDGMDENIAVKFFKTLGDYAAKKNVCIGMEANPEIYGTNFVNTTEQAFDLIRRVGSDGFKLNLDVGTMIQNGESISVLQKKVMLINHVHISEPFLKKIEARELHRDLVDFLKKEKYSGFVSVEMGMQDNLSDIESAMKYVVSIDN